MKFFRLRPAGVETAQRRIFYFLKSNLAGVFNFSVSSEKGVKNAACVVRGVTIFRGPVRPLV